jgi:pimeloyl-ACP methyl ester carboxylesterase
MANHLVSGGGGLKLHVEETGNPEGKPILFIHGFSQCRLSWAGQMQSNLLANDFRLLAMDIRGHGLSEKPKDAYADSKLWADDVHAVITTLALHEPVLVGWSYGGVIVSDYVLHYGEDRIGGVNWVGAVSRLGDALVQPGYIGEEFLACVPGFFSDDASESEAALEKLIRLCMHEQPANDVLQFVLSYNVDVPSYVRRGLLSRQVNNDTVIENMRKPMLLTYGEQDRITPSSMRSRMAEIAKGGKLSVYPNVGHAPFVEAPERFNRELAEFRKSV